MCEENEILASSSFFQRFTMNPIDMDDGTFSPTSVEPNPTIYVRKPSRPDNVNDFNAVKDDSCYKSTNQENVKTAFTRLLPPSCKSYDNLAQLQKEKRDACKYLVTRSLPPSPLTTPAGTPDGSPRTPRHAMKERRNFDELWNAQLWFYPGIFRSNLVKHEANEIRPLDYSANAKGCEEPKILDVNSKENSLRLPAKEGGNSGFGGFAKKKFFVTNRDMNFLAPTST